jgi:hypothetical protein
MLAGPFALEGWIADACIKNVYKFSFASVTSQAQVDVFRQSQKRWCEI